MRDFTACTAVCRADGCEAAGAEAGAAAEEEAADAAAAAAEAGCTSCSSESGYSDPLMMRFGAEPLVSTPVTWPVTGLPLPVLTVAVEPMRLAAVRFEICWFVVSASWSEVNCAICARNWVSSSGCSGSWFSSCSVRSCRNCVSVRAELELLALDAVEAVVAAPDAEDVVELTCMGRDFSGEGL